MTRLLCQPGKRARDHYKLYQKSDGAESVLWLGRRTGYINRKYHGHPISIQNEQDLNKVYASGLPDEVNLARDSQN